MLSHSIVWHFLHVVCNILNIQRYVTSLAGQTCSYSDKAANRREAGNISASTSMNTVHCYDIVRHFYRADMASLAWPTAALRKIAMKMFGLQQDCVT